MKKLITLAICSLFSMTLSAQKLDYDNDSKWFWGFNVGAAWNTTDVKNKTNLGWGLILGRSFNYNYGKKLSFDLRLRYLGGNWYGQDYDTTSVLNNPAYEQNSQVIQTYDTLGYTINNFQTEAHELGLELVLHANSLRENTGWDPYIFGGANIVWNQTMGDLKLADSLGGSTYPYLPEGITKPDWNLMSDDIYDTALDGSTGDKFNVNFMPSFGFGLAYQVGPRFSVGVEHKTTFALKNTFDGYNQESMKWGLFENDIYHYTSAFLKFNLKKRKTTETNNNTNNAVTPGCISPKVRLVQPRDKTITVYARDYKVKAVIENISGRENIQYELNGIVSNNFVYETNNKNFESNLNLVPGTNKVVIRAGNACGTATESVTINYIDCIRPTIVFQNPIGSGVSVDTELFMIAADITGADHIDYQFNGVSSVNYSYSGNSFYSNQNLVEGNNTIKIIATNSCGSVEQTVNVEYTTCASPFIKIVRNARGAKFDSKTHDFVAKVVNAENAGNIVVQLNGVNQSFDFNAQTGVLKSLLVLLPGANSIKITASNSCGSDEATMTVTYTPCSDPVIGLISPASNSITVQSSTQLIQASVLNITSADQIQLELNGVVSSGGTYSPSTKIFEKSLRLQIGLNTIKLTATNECGSESIIITIRRDTIGVNDNMITICHYPPGNTDNPQQLQIPLSAWKAHQAHGDVLGPCPVVEDPADDMIMICHYPPGNTDNPQPLEIPLSAWEAHQAHGDVLGPCPVIEDPADDMIMICHYPPGNTDNPQPLEIPLSAWEAHQAHGDVLGPCPVIEDPADDMITICHYPPGNKKNPQQLEIPISAWPAHQAHGDVLGPCPEEEEKPGKGEGNKPKKGDLNGNEEKEDNEKKPKKP